MPDLKLATPDFIDSAPFRVLAEATVNAPIDSCWELLVDQASWVQWFKDMSSVEASPWIWTQPGQTRTVSVNGLKVKEVAISLDADSDTREYAFAIANWPLPTAVQAAEAVRLDDRTTGGQAKTLITYVGAFESTPMGKRLEKVLEKQLSKAWAPAFENLGQMASARATQSARPSSNEMTGAARG